ncbi:hypothetical protein [Paenibacillus sp. NAIST15-1]|uniref:hypothetical protein n=1 Tax=Paenibacillus sp. NAIST15-1 TaxID=1605994 RepID=UPI0008686FBC|nr:hypothetical protein [Paenibacillus sp. NAIST15-1]GAV10286.1 hypothetical protein PBN151_0191 [Paenibacillus sp. NAIST15-1]
MAEQEQEQEQERAQRQVKERQRYEQGFLDCRNVQVSIALQEWGVPVELLYYNAWESTRSVYEHLYVNKKLPWLYESPCLVPSELGLIGVAYEEVQYATYEDADTILQDVDYSEQAAFLWIVCGESPYVKPGFYGHPESVHSVWVQGLSSTSSLDSELADCTAGAGYWVRDTYPEFEGFVSETDFRRMVDSPYVHLEDRQVFLVRRPERNDSADKGQIMERFLERQRGLHDDATFYDMICRTVNQPEPEFFPEWTELYDCHSHAFKFLAGSRYAYSCFAETLVSSEHSWVRQLRDIARRADKLKNVFLMAVQSGRVDGQVVHRMCTELYRLEQEWLASGHVELGQEAQLRR